MNNKKLLDQIRETIRIKHYSIRTEKTYVEWAKRFVWYDKKIHPLNIGKKEINAFLSYLAVKAKLSA